MLRDFFHRFYFSNNDTRLRSVGSYAVCGPVVT